VPWGCGRPPSFTRKGESKTRHDLSKFKGGSTTLEYWEDEGWYVGRLREVPGVFSQGKSLEELEENIKEAYKLMLEDQPPVAQETYTKQLVLV
jgi:predicted RNase H-like HicB family nuclease